MERAAGRIRLRLVVPRAALATTQLPFGVVNAPGQRYHPAIIAQAIATLAQMFPGRFWAALGSGEASNERVNGEPWPRKDVRDQRLIECVDVIRRLLAGEEVNHDGLVKVNRGRLWTLPDAVPDLIGPAVTPETAARHAAWADGLVTVNQSKETLLKVLDSYRAAGGRGLARLQIHLSWAPTEDEAVAIAHDQWRSNVFGPPVCWDLETVEAFDVISQQVTAEQVNAVRTGLQRPRHSTPRGCRSTSSRAGTSSTSTSSARIRRPSSTRSASTCFRNSSRRRRARCSHEAKRHE